MLSGQPAPCGLHEAHAELFALRPGSRAAALEAERQLELETQQGELEGNRAEVLVIPVVFHIIHFNGPENISAAQIHDAVDVLNTNFRALNEAGDIETCDTCRGCTFINADDSEALVEAKPLPPSQEHAVSFFARNV